MPFSPELIFLMNPVLLSGLVRGELAATTADALAHGGAGCIIFTGRSQPEVQPVIDHLNRKHPKTKIIFVTANPGSSASIRAAAGTIKALAVPIDGLVGFPTVMAADWELTPDGIESHFQKNYLVYFVLVKALMDMMPIGSRVILVTTSVRQEAHAPRWEDVNFSVSLFSLSSVSAEMLNHGSCRTVKPTIHSMDTRSRCLRTSCLSNLLPSRVLNGRLQLSLSTLEVSLLARLKTPWILMAVDTKTNIQTFVSSDEVASWLQRKKDGTLTHASCISSWILVDQPFTPSRRGPSHLATASTQVPSAGKCHCASRVA